MRNDDNDIAEQPKKIVQAHYHQLSERSARGVDNATIGLGVGGLAGIIGHYVTNLHLSSKLFAFDSKALQKTRDDILGRGAGASTAPGSLNGLAAGMSNHEIEQANRYILAEEAEFGLAKRVMKLGGRHSVSMLVGLVTAIVGFGAYMALAPKRKPDESVRIDGLTEPKPAKDTAAEHEKEANAAPHHPSSHAADVTETTTREHHKNWQDAVANEASHPHASQSMGA